jgi:hypothetical protein
MDIVKARRLLKSFNPNRKWALKVSRMSDETVYAILERLAQQVDMRNVA